MSLRTLNIAPRAFLGFALIGCLMLFLGTFALIQMGKIHAATERITQDTLPSIKSVDDFTQLSLRLRVHAYRLLVNRDPVAQQRTLDAMAERNRKIDEARPGYEALISMAEERAAYDQYIDMLTQHRQLESRLIELSRSNQLDTMQELLNTQLMDSAEKINATLNRLVQINTRYATEAAEEAAQLYRDASNLVMALLTLATALTLLFAWLLTRSITLPIAK
uniref:MCP four helix bundle domain-containing protein n=2 Tax=unclassified Pseudomonas TaxID=196821 RepID=UPI000AB63FD6